MNKKPDTPNHESHNETQDETRDEDFFQQYLQGDNPLSELYQQSDAPVPSSKLNQTILSAARRQANRHHWWMNPGSWAATIAIISLVGLLSHNTWQTEQDSLPYSKAESEYQPQSASTKVSREARDKKQHPAKPDIQADEQKDSRRLLYKSAPAPALQSAPALPTEGLSDSVLREEDLEAMIPLSEIEAQKPATENSLRSRKQLSGVSSEQQQWLQHIELLLRKNQLDEAQEQFLLFRKKYPDYPVDPVILRQLSPY